LLIIPPLFADLRDAALDVPKNTSIALEKLDTMMSAYGIHVPYDRQSLIDFAGAYSEKISDNVLKSAGSFLSNSLVNAASVIVILLNLFMIPIFFAYVVNDAERLVEKIENLVPPSKRPSLHAFMSECDRVLSGYIRGQLLVCVILSVLYTAGLLIVGIKFAVIIGVMTGFLSIIPYVGFGFGFAAAFVTALANFEGVGALVGIAIAYGLVQLLESFVVTPRIVGDKVGLTPFEAILALIVLGNLFGFIGLFLAIPTGAVTKILFRNLLAEYKKTTFYKV
jgi:predicted PurR-regulated permease PerM